MQKQPYNDLHNIKFAENLMEIGHISREQFDEKIRDINNKYR